MLKADTTEADDPSDSIDGSATGSASSSINPAMATLNPGPHGAYIFSGSCVDCCVEREGPADGERGVFELPFFFF